MMAFRKEQRLFTDVSLNCYFVLELLYVYAKRGFNERDVADGVKMEMWQREN